MAHDRTDSVSDREGGVDTAEAAGDPLSEVGGSIHTTIDKGGNGDALR